MKSTLLALALAALFTPAPPAQDPANPPAQDPANPPAKPAPAQGRRQAAKQKPGEQPAPAPVATPDADVPPELKALSRSEKESSAAFFVVCDYDGNGWISFREASESLGLDRAAYAVYDTDHDGRISPAEFEARYQSILEQTGGFRPPAARKVTQAAPSRNAEQLLSAYDADSDRALNAEELQRLLTDYGREEFPVDVVIEKLDRDGSKKLEGEELVLFAQLLTATYLADKSAPDPNTRPKSVGELFGQVIPRSASPGTTPEPPLIRGPVPHFRRLDLDDDGRITLTDLQSLQVPLQLSVRVGGIFAALDRNQDGGIDSDEFLNSMQKARK